MKHNSDHSLLALFSTRKEKNHHMVIPEGLGFSQGPTLSVFSLSGRIISGLPIIVKKNGDVLFLPQAVKIDLLGRRHQGKG